MGGGGEGRGKSDRERARVSEYACNHTPSFLTFVETLSNADTFTNNLSISQSSNKRVPPQCLVHYPTPLAFGGGCVRKKGLRKTCPYIYVLVIRSSKPLNLLEIIMSCVYAFSRLSSIVSSSSSLFFSLLLLLLLLLW